MSWERQNIQFSLQITDSSRYSFEVELLFGNHQAFKHPYGFPQISWRENIVKLLHNSARCEFLVGGASGVVSKSDNPNYAPVASVCICFKSVIPPSGIPRPHFQGFPDCEWCIPVI